MEKEEERTAFIVRRLGEFGVGSVSPDGEGNVAVLFPGTKPTDECALLFADIENDAYSPLDSSARLSGGVASGNGLADNSIGVAALLVLAEYFQKNRIQHDINIVMLFTRLAYMNEEFAGLRRFLSSWDGKISFAFYVTGIQQGNIEAHSQGHYKLTVTAHTGEHEVMENSSQASAVSVLSNIAFRLGAIRWDTENSTTLNIARIVGGVGYGFFPSEGFLELEIYSGTSSALEMTKNAVEATIRKIAAETGASVDFTVNSFIPVSDAEINAFLTDALKKIHGELKIKSSFVSVPDKTAILNSFGIPAVSIGITRGKKSLGEEYVELAPVETGFRQLILLLERGIVHGELREP
jgi:acetylornithine deacetylase/succinyl-diaminopimelate desuccinylase-like protein